MARQPSLRGVAARALRITGRHWRPLGVIALVVFVPLGFLEAIDHGLGDLDPDELSDAAAFGVAAVAFAHVGTALLGEVFFAGVVAGAAHETHGGSRRTLGELARAIPYGRIAAIDVLYSAAIGIGLLALVVPGILVFGFFALAAPLAEVEHLGVRAAFARSLALVRGHFGLVLAALLPIALAGQAIAAGAVAATTALAGEGFAAEWLAATVVELFAAPAWALAAVALTFELRDAAQSNPGGVRSGQPVAASS